MSRAADNLNTGRDCSAGLAGMASSTLVQNMSFLLSHFDAPLFPRTISTFGSNGRQFEIFGVDEALAAFEKANYLDCRINMYKSYTQYKGINRQPPGVVFIDIDRSTFGSDSSLKKALNRTLQRIRDYIDGIPTVTWSGNGYHIIQPLAAHILEEDMRFECYPDLPLSNVFLRFCEWFLSAGVSDPNHNPSVRSCLVRVPGTHNSKCILAGKESQVKLIQMWDGRRPKIDLLLGSFSAALAKKRATKSGYSRQAKNSDLMRSGNLLWIEHLLKYPIKDFRKNAANLILAPYLINIKRISAEDAEAIIVGWLGTCDQLRKLDFNSDRLARSAVTYAASKGYLPLRLDSLRSRNPSLYHMLQE
jgi:hypothetical protein